MSGVFGIINPERPANLEHQLDAMGKVMSHQEWTVIDQYLDLQSGIGLGRIGIGIFNKERQPIWDSEQAIAIFMAGEFYDTEHAKQNLPADKSDEALALHLYSQVGDDFVKDVEGAFVLAIWDTRHRQLHIINDRFGLYPTYLAQIGDTLIFAPEVKAALLNSEVDRSLRDDAVAEYFRFQRLLGLKTFFKGIHLLPPASILTFDGHTNTYQKISYWSFNQLPLLPRSLTFDEKVEEGGRRLRAAIEKRSKGSQRVGVYLSGGLDSRSLLGLIPENSGTIHTFTFGQRGSRDEHYASQIAHIARSQHHFHAFDNGKWIIEASKAHIELTEGYQNWLHLHGFTMLGEVRQSIDVNLSGLGDIIWDDHYFFPPDAANAVDDIAFNSRLFEIYNQRYSWPGINETEERSLYHKSFYPRVQGLAFDSLVTESAVYADIPYYQRLRAFSVVNHFNRHLLYHAVYGRSHVEYRLPYFDLDLFSFCYGLQGEVDKDRELQISIIAKEVPELARIPRASTELPLTYNNRNLAIPKTVKRLKSAINRYVKPVFPTHSSLYADYETWLKTDLRSWAEGILFDERTLSRGIFQSETLHSLMNRHLSGFEQWTIGKIAPIITFEMMMRRYFD
jgi:asparagine synthase (glutamine-hydrolysing)